MDIFSQRRFWVAALPVIVLVANSFGVPLTEDVLNFLKTEYPKAFGEARVRAYGFPGIRQTRWIVGRHQLTLGEVQSGVRHADAIARTAWPVELHDTGKGYVWQTFAQDHTHYVPLGALVPAEADNVCAAGRCIDADLAALSSVRVMGPCMAMGMAVARGELPARRPPTAAG